MKQGAGELSGGIEIGPVNARTLLGSIGNIVAEGRVKGGKAMEIRGVIGILVARVHSFPF